MGQANRLRDVARAERMARVIEGLAQSGAVNASCHAAGVHPGLVCSWRHKYPDFAERWVTALAQFRTTRVTALAEPRRPSRYARWSASTIDRFVDTLAATGDEAAAARSVGKSKEAVYRFRRRDAAFRAAWASAVDQGYAQVEIGMIGEAINGVAPRKPGALAPASERVRNSVYQSGMRRAAALRAATDDEAERDRNEALAAKWVNDFRAEVERLEGVRQAGGR